MKHPQKIGSYWSTKKYVHGPRLRQPKEFESIYLSTQAGARKRKQGIINKSWKLPPSTRLKIGHLKHNKRLAIQSFLTPASKWKYVQVRPHKRKSKIVHGYRRRQLHRESGSGREWLLNRMREDSEKAKQERALRGQQEKEAFIKKQGINIPNLISESAELQRVSNPNEEQRQRLRDITQNLKERKEKNDTVMLAVAHDKGIDLDFLKSYKQSFFEYLGKDKYNEENFGKFARALESMYSRNPDIGYGQRIFRELGVPFKFEEEVQKIVDIRKKAEGMIDKGVYGI